MHFWIDKRSQSCGFGRARVSASLSGGTGIGFGHHPRRIGGKSMVTPIHRYPSVDFRSHNNNVNRNTSTAAVAATATAPIQSQTISNNQSAAIHQQAQIQQQPPTLYNHQPLINVTIGSHQHGHHQQHMFSHHTQQRAYSTRSHHHYQLQSPSSQQATTAHQHNQPPVAFQPECHVPIGHFGPIELEQVSLNMGSSPLPPLSAHPSLAPSGSSVLPSVTGVDSQLLPGHLKCGMWASLALATVFVAVFQGTGLEVIIFCAFSAIFFLAACTISLCRRPRDLLSIAQPPILAIDHTTVTDVRHSDQQQQQHTLIIQSQMSNQMQIQNHHNSNASQNILEVPPTESAAPPPPYHIAILLPDIDMEPDESPPPAYDKIQI